jgi:arginyl-tRNA synthetase
MVFERELGIEIADIFKNTFGSAIEPDKLVFQATRKEFPGDITLVVFNLSKSTGKKPEEIGEVIGNGLVSSGKWISGFNVVKGFLNIEIKPELWLERFYKSYGLTSPKASTGKHVLVEYSSPNTNKPLHLGHMRNNLLGYAIGEILKLNGNKVTKVNIINDRGIHICKSMLAWKLFGNGETPITSGIKGDHLVGKYYVEFDKHYKREVADLVAGGMEKEKAEKDAPLMVQARNMLQDWEAGDVETLDLWRLMNSWVYEGFDITYKRLGVDFDKLYYESETYILGKQIVEEGLRKGVFYRRSDNSVWVDLRNEGLDEKLLLRSDGTSVYITQDLGTAVKRHEDFGFDSMVYVVGNEQDYHFKVLFLILAKLGYDWASRLYHLSYNMVDLPSGKMKSREGTVVDADDLMDEMSAEAEKITRELGKLQNPDSVDSKLLYNQIGMGALKYFLLKVDPEKRMLFDPNESIDFNGNTGPFIQYTHARIRSVLRKADTMDGFGDYSMLQMPAACSLNDKERDLVKTILAFDELVTEAAHKLSPAVIANYVYDLSKSFNQFYHENAIVDSERPSTSMFRLHLCYKASAVISLALSLLGIHAPEQM